MHFGKYFILLSNLLLAFHHPLASVDPALEDHAKVNVTVERTERLSSDEVRWSVKIANETGKAVFLPGWNVGRANPHLLFLEHLEESGNWKTIFPCIDTPPPNLIELRSGANISVQRVLNLGEFRNENICKERSIQYEGVFRFRLEYFETEREGQAYLKKVRQRGYQPAQGNIAISQLFKVPEVAAR